MPYVPFYELLPAIAGVETRVITLMSSKNEFNLPVGEYAFVEAYCDECDCRRVFLNVIKKGIKEPVSIISWGWENEQFYTKWYGKYEKDVIEEMMGSALPMMSPQSVYSPKLLKMFDQLLLKDAVYTARIKKHYDLFRRELKKKQKQ